MLKPELEKALNSQINKEFYSAYLYYSMSAYFDSINLKGFSNWMRVQALEEMTHGEKILNYVKERGGKVKLTQIDAPETEWESPLAAIEQVYNHEQKVTDSINYLVDLAHEFKDHATNNMLQWFVGEQVEEEASADDILQQLKLIEKSGGAGLFMLDKELAARTFVPPVGE